MKKFSYSMQKILDLRVFQQQQAEAELGKINAQVTAVQNRLDEIARKRVEAQGYCDASGDAFVLNDTVSFMVFLDQKKEEQLQEMARLQVIQEEKRENVRKAMQNVKVLEKLKAKKLEDWKDEYLKEEELVQDDVVTSQEALKKIQ